MITFEAVSLGIEMYKTKTRDLSSSPFEKLIHLT